MIPATHTPAYPVVMESTCVPNQKLELRTATSIFIVSPSALNFKAINRNTNPHTLDTMMPSQRLLNDSMTNPTSTLIKPTKIKVSYAVYEKSAVRARGLFYSFVGSETFWAKLAVERWTLFIFVYYWLEDGWRRPQTLSPPCWDGAIFLLRRLNVACRRQPYSDQ